MLRYLDDVGSKSSVFKRLLSVPDILMPWLSLHYFSTVEFSQVFHFTNKNWLLFIKFRLYVEQQCITEDWCDSAPQHP